MFFEAGGELSRRDVVAVQLEVDDIGLHRFGVEDDTVQFGDAVGQFASVGVVVGKPFNHFGYGNDAGCGDDAGLARAAAEDLTHAAGMFNEIGIADYDRADGGAEPLAQADTYAVGFLDEAGGGDVEGDCGIPETCAIDMELEAVTVRRFAGGVHVFHGQAAAAAAIVGILDGQQACTRVVLVIRADGVHNQVQVQGTIVGGRQRAGMDASERGGAALFGGIDVGLIAEDHFIAATAVAKYGGEISHGAAGHEQGGLLSEQFCCQCLEPVDGWVFAVDVVADGRGGHRLSHFVGGVSDGIGTEIDRFLSQNSYLSSCQ